MKIDRKSLKYQLWIYFVLFAVLIMAILWMLQIVFLRSFYQSMKTAQVVKIANSLINDYGNEDFGDKMFQLAYNNGISIQAVDLQGNGVLEQSENDGQLGVGQTENTQGSEIGQQNANIDEFEDSQANNNSHSAGNKNSGPYIENFINFKDKLLSSPSKTISYTITSGKVKGTILIYGAVMKDKNGNTALLYVNAPLEPIDTTTVVLQTQLIAVILISLLLAFFISFFISNKFTKPIAKITTSAELLATGDYDVHFADGGYTEINHLATTLNYATNELSKVDELRREIIANVSHDLRTPLTMIKAYAEMIRDLSGDNPQKRNAHINVIIDESDRLSLLVNDILNLSKLESQLDDKHMTVFSLSDLVREIMNRFRVYSERYGFCFSLEIDEGNSNIYADAIKIQQVVYNLITNAINHTGDDKIVKIRVINTEGRVRFEVADTGKGISKEDLKLIWDRYYKAEKTHKRGIAGTGLGLSIVKSILTLHNARYGVDSVLGKGSTFWFEHLTVSNPLPLNNV